MNGFRFDGRHSDEFSLIVNKKSVPITPPIESRLQEISGFDGAWDYGVSYSPREIEIECTLLADSKEDLKSKIRSLAGMLNPRKGAKPLIFDDEPNIQYFARLSNQIPLEQLGAMGTFTLQFVCPDPFTYAVTQKQLNNPSHVNLLSPYSVFVDNDGDGVAEGYEDSKGSTVAGYSVEDGWQVLDSDATDTSIFVRYVESRQFAIDNDGHFLMMVDSEIDNGELRIALRDPDGNFLIDDRENFNSGVHYAKFETTAQIYRFTLGNIVTAGTVGTVKVKYPRLYQIDQATYDKIDVDPEFTGDKLIEKFPFVEKQVYAIEHIGTHIARPKLTVTHGGGAATITNERSDGITETINFTDDSPSGTYVIDCKEMTITVDGAAGYNFVKGDFFSIPEGTNSINYSGAISKLSIEYHDTWL